VGPALPKRRHRKESECHWHVAHTEFRIIESAFFLAAKYAIAVLSFIRNCGSR
jgi:hypothetical protein